MRCVIKLGGSLHVDPILKVWLDMLVEYGAGKVVIVPGGGLFADAVRSAQQVWNFDDVTAHRMALLAMGQYALQLQAIQPALIGANSLAAIENALQANQIPIWLPNAMVSVASEIPATWNISSDSLAAWLAHQMHATQLILVKTCDVDADLSVTDLASDGIVDVCFAEMIRGRNFAVDVVSKNEWQRVREMLVKKAISR